MYLLYYDQFSSGYDIPCTGFIRIQFSRVYAIPCIWYLLFHVLALLGFSSSGYAIPCTCFSIIIRIQFSSGYAIPCTCFIMYKSFPVAIPCTCFIMISV